MLVYSMRNRRSGRRYVGKTARTLRRRTWEHTHIQSPSSPIDRAIAKHGVAAFEIEVLERCADEGELSMAERRWIAHFDTFRGRGYNCTDGGNGILGYRHTEETKRLMSETRPGRKMPPRTVEHSKNMSESRRGEKNPNWGGISDTHRRNISAGHMKSETRFNNGRHRSVEQLDMEGNVVGTYPSLKAAATSLGTQYQGISQCCRGVRNLCAGYGWRYTS